MSRSFILSCESTVDLPYAYMDGRGIPVLFYSYQVDGQTYPDDMLRTPGALEQFYDFLAQGKLPTTSQLNQYDYLSFFRPLVEQGDLMHIAFGTGMTGSVNNAYLAAEQLREEFPNRRIIVIDSLCSSSGYGMLVDSAADLADAGQSMDEVEQWVLAHRQRIHHQFYSTDLTHYRRSGRISGAAAAVGTLLSICPIMRLDAAGRIIAYDKVRGKKNALKATISTMLEHIDGGADYDGKCWVCHSNALSEAELTRDAVLAALPNVKNVRICDIGTIIAAHCGPGTVAVFFFGDERAPE